MLAYISYGLSAFSFALIIVSIHAIRKSAQVRRALAKSMSQFPAALDDSRRRHELRAQDGPLRVRLVADLMEVHAFAQELRSQIQAAGGVWEIVTVGEEMVHASYPLHVVAIPDGGAALDIQPLGMDLASEHAELEAQVLSMAADASKARKASKASQRI